METPLPAAAADARGGSYGALKASLLALQSATAALTQRCEVASLELLDEKECQEVMVDKLAEIRVRRMQAYLHAPDSGMALFMEQTKPKARSLQPTTPRRDLRRSLVAQWEALTKDEQEEWETRLHALSATPLSGKTEEVQTTPKKPIMTPTSANSVASGSNGRKPASKRKATGTAGRVTSSGESKSKKRRTAAAPATTKVKTGPSTPKTPQNSRSKTSKAPASSASGSTSTPRARKAAASSRKTKAAAASTTDSPASSPPAKTKPAARSQKARSSPASRAKASKPTPKKKAKPSKQQKPLVELDSQEHPAFEPDHDDDDGDDDDDNDDDSVSSAGGSASPSDEDSDENMAQLPTGAFG